MADIHCPRCKTEFEFPDWESGNCPTCGNYFWPEDFVTEDFSDSWMEIHWDDYTPQEQTDARPSGTPADAPD